MFEKELANIQDMMKSHLRAICNLSRLKYLSVCGAKMMKESLNICGFSTFDSSVSYQAIVFELYS